jgi:hypothetical protein
VDWLKPPDRPAGWGLGGKAHLLVGALSHSGRWPGALINAEDFPHLVEALNAALQRSSGSGPDSGCSRYR